MCECGWNSSILRNECGEKEKSGKKSREEEGEIVWRLVGSGREREIGEGEKTRIGKREKLWLWWSTKKSEEGERMGRGDSETGNGKGLGMGSEYERSGVRSPFF